MPDNSSLSRPNFSSRRDHEEKFGHPLSHSDFTSLRSFPDCNSLHTAESIVIKQHCPDFSAHCPSPNPYNCCQFLFDLSVFLFGGASGGRRVGWLGTLRQDMSGRRRVGWLGSFRQDISGGRRL